MKKILILSLILLNACGTIVDKNHMDVYITSKPYDAEIYLDGDYVGKTNKKINLKGRGSDGNLPSILTLKKEGYEDYEEEIIYADNAWILGNIVFGGIIGIVVDWVNGYDKEVNNHKIDIDLKQIKTENV